LRRAKGLPGFRSERLHGLLKRAIRDTRREGFRITHYSVQQDHIHIIVEAEDKTTLSNGMRSLAVRVAMRVNRRILGRRRGRVWGDRYHRRDLTSPSDVRNALVYVLANHLKHGECDVGLLDPCSSGPWFTGWFHALEPPAERAPVQPATTWVLRKGWSRWAAARSASARSHARFVDWAILGRRGLLVGTGATERAGRSPRRPREIHAGATPRRSLSSPADPVTRRCGGRGRALARPSTRP
jgi:putative transposase